MPLKRGIYYSKKRIRKDQELLRSYGVKENDLEGILKHFHGEECRSLWLNAIVLGGIMFVILAGSTIVHIYEIWNDY